MSTAASDPYYVARDAVNLSISEIQISFRKWDGILSGESSSSSSFSDYTRGLLEDVDRLEEDLAVIDSSIRVVEANPTRFSLRVGELDNRKQWSAVQHRLCADLRSKLNGPQAKAKMDADKKKVAASEAEELRRKKLAEDSNHSSIGASKQVHQQIVHQQDETLTELARVTDRLGQTALVINTELQDQQRLLTELDRDIDRQQEKMNYVMGKMAKLLKTNDTKQLMMVIILLVISIILFMWNLGF
jgi:chromosome segregation ATPase